MNERNTAAQGGCAGDKKKLRSGFTTGTCAAAAVKAAVLMLRLQRKLDEVTLCLPDGREEVFPLEDAAFSEAEGGIFKSARCAVKKYAGDDPDVTNGALVFGAVRRIPEGKTPCQLTEKPLFISEDYPFLFLTGGEGIGMVTKRGLPCEPGFYAINPVPRSMIFEAAAAAALRSGQEKGGNLLLEVSIPAGKALAERTFNPKLGIRGGISILGTSGIVNPMSEQALLETIRLDIRVKAREGRTLLAVAPGNYGEKFLKEKLGVSMDAFVKCSNFIGDTFTMLRDEGIREVLLAGHAGKLIKVAGGVLNTHSGYGDRRMEIFCDCAKEAGVPESVAGKLLSMNTTEEAVEFLEARGYREGTAAVILGRIQRVIRDCSGITPEVVIFSSVSGLLGMTEGAAKAAKQLYIKADEE